MSLIIDTICKETLGSGRETLGSGLEISVKEAGTHRGRSLLLNKAVMSGENRGSE